jgi:site-specific DNA-cytosine methylase
MSSPAHGDGGAALRAVSLFSGVGGFERGLAGAGVPTVASVEISAASAGVLRHNFPGTALFGDVKDVRFDDLQDAGFVPQTGILTAGSPCFPAGTLVLSESGLVPIEDVSVGDMVYTHRGRWRRVLRTGGKKDAPLVLVKGRGGSVTCTPDHPFYSVRKFLSWVEGKQAYKISDPEWVDAQDLVGRYWTTPSEFPPSDVPPCDAAGAQIPFDPGDTEFAWLVGRYLADGWTRFYRGKGSVIFGIGENKSDYFRDRIASSEFPATESVERTARKFSITRTAMASWVYENFGSGSSKKRIPGWVYGAPEKWRKELLNGYLSGDGWQPNDYTWTANTISRELAFGLVLLAQSLGMAASVTESRPKSTQRTIEGRQVTIAEVTYYMRFSWPKNRRTSISVGPLETGKVRSVEPGGYADVYNLEVEEDNSYTANLRVVHNCQDVSIANVRRDGFDGERSGLFHEFVRLCEAPVPPEWLLFENVPGLLSSRGGRDMGAVVGTLVERGYRIAWRVLDAQCFGVPQRRRRLFVVGRAGGRSGAAEVLGITDSGIQDPDPLGRTEAGVDTGRAGAAASRVFVKARRAQTNTDHETWVQGAVNPTLNAFDISAGRATTMVAAGDGLRRLTPVEHERLQGFPDDWTRWARRADGRVVEQSDSARYGQLGNAVAVPVVEALARRIVQQHHLVV